MLRLRLGLCVVLLLGLMLGCSSSRSPLTQAKISGMVKYKGTPVPAGTIAFHSESSGVYTSPINTDGTYEIGDLPTGNLVVTVETESQSANKQAPDYGGVGSKGYAERVAMEKKMGAPIKQTPLGEYRKIPQKYSNPKTSPLSVNLEPGRNVQEFELKD